MRGADMSDYTVMSTGIKTDAMEKKTRTLIRLERLEGKPVCSNVDGENQDEVFEMLGDCLAEQLYEHPEYRGQMKTMFRDILRNTPKSIDLYLNGIAFAVCGAFCLIGALWVCSQLAHGILHLLGVV